MTHASSILIVDDEPAGRDTLESLLVAEGYQMAFASNGREALEKAAELNPDVILLDVMMPGMDGFDVCRRLRNDPRLAEVPIVLVTALDDRDSRLRGLDAGADDFLTKPFDRAELRSRVRTICRLNRYRRLQAERTRFAWVVDQAEDGFLIVEANDTIRYANPRARLYLGLPPEPQVVAGSFLQWALRSYRHEPTDAWASWPEPPPHSGERYLIRPETPDTHEFWLHVRCLDLPVDDSMGRVVRLHDVTDKVIATRQMVTFHALVSHKLRTPLNGLVVGLEMLTKEAALWSTAEIVEWAAMALRGAERLDDEIQEVFRFLNATAVGRSDSGFSLSQLAAVVDRISSALNMQAVTTVLDAELYSAHLRLSPEAVEMALGELLENAKKFHPSRAPRVEVVASRADAAQVRLRVRDDGVTLSPAQLARVWTPYYQGEKDGTGQVAGMGLGLASVATIVWGVGGTTSMQNRTDGAGVVIDLVIPLHRPAGFEADAKGGRWQESA